MAHTVSSRVGGWGLWERITSINHLWLGWNSLLRFHVWPRPFKFAVVQNIPAFLIGLLLSWPIDSFKPGLPLMGFTIAVASAGACTLVFDWSLAGPETIPWAYEWRNRGAHIRRLHRFFFDCGGEFRMDSWLLHHVHSARHLVLDCVGNRHVSFGTPLGAGRGLVRTFLVSVN